MGGMKICKEGQQKELTRTGTEFTLMAADDENSKMAETAEGDAKMALMSS